MEQQPPRKSTEMTFEKPSFQCHSKFDDLDVKTDVIQALERRVPNHFLVIALIQQLCSVYIENLDERSETFNVLCEQLARMKILPSFALHEDFQAVRDKYVAGFHSFLLAASGGDVHENSLNFVPGAQGNLLVTRCPSMPRRLVQAKQILEYNSSRYKEEFQELGRLGKGGFGSVYKVKNRLDGREYAVKKVHLSEKDLSNCLKVIREVKVLARLRHTNVVGYQSAWLEFVFSESAASSALPRISTHPSRLVNLDDQSPLSSSLFKRNDSIDSDGNLIVFQNSENSLENEVSDGVKDLNKGSPSPHLKLEDVFSDLHISVNNLNGIHKSASDANLERFSTTKSYKSSHLHSHKYSHRQHGNVTKGNDTSCSSDDSASGKSSGIVLFIQMELCAITLRQWLFERNLGIFVNGDQVNKNDNMNIFRQIINGVKYIHSQGLIHRDLKPGNIFLQHREKRYDGSYEHQVKIGDFGLARNDYFRSDLSSGNEFRSMIEPLSPLFPCANSCSSNSTAPTLGVGTCTYASPEQLHNENYDSKVDIYSLGIILFEFYQPFNTEMEKHKTIKAIRKGIMAEDFKKLWPKQSELILRMMSEDPNDRPTAESILTMDIFSENNECVPELLKKLETKQKENEFLRAKIHELELELKNKNETIAQLRTNEKTNCDKCSCVKL